ncbi:hypothetical protein [Marinobacter zhejiangensis]|uniref:Uncharacterized protein n=1 Tax=Marinobacter zhejiangensis TaxID=488535 RepID=A0A1I4LAI5_9GAMM|nr:hypothetical protein [Marinobacter zhejiangensis]SFL88045.1 hypothetical protein SAMN04487963_0377 [Marinobacter zhejiangensis]
MTESCISAGSPCKEPDKLYVEVAGANIHEGYGLVLEKDGELVSQLTMEQKENHQLYQCDYAVSPGDGLRHTLTLTVDRLQGEPLRFPLQDAPRATRQSPRIQPNLLFPVYPLARLPRVQTEPGHALLRPGYLYVFWKGVLWRELKTDENGKLQDIDLAHWRHLARDNAHSGLSRREAAGVVVDTLWVPARFEEIAGTKWTIDDVELAWSEQQWSWEYIESLESGRDVIKLPDEFRALTGIPAYGKDRELENEALEKRGGRCEDLSRLKSYRFPERFGADSLGNSDWIPAAKLSPSRQRNLAQEFDASDPFLVTQALDGNGLQSDGDCILHSLKTELERLEGHVCKANEVADFVQGLFTLIDDTLGKEWTDRTGGSNQSNIFSSDRTDNAEQARRTLLDTVYKRLRPAPEDSDQLAPIRERAIAAVPLRDDLYELAWLTNQSSMQLHLMSAIVDSTQEHPHFKSAMLLHASLFDKKSWERGPFDDYCSDVNMELLDQALRKGDREACRRAYYELQERRVRLLQSGAFYSFNDLFSLNDVDYLTAFATLNLVMTNLDASAFTFDSLAGKATREYEAYRDQIGSRFITGLAESKVGLCKYLKNDDCPIPLDRELTEPLPEVANDGSGKLRPALLYHLSHSSLEASEIPEALRTQYEVSKEEKQYIVRNIARLGDSELMQWTQASYTTLGQLVADVISELYDTFQRVVLQSLTSGDLMKSAHLLEMPASLIKVGNPFMHDLVFRPRGLATAIASSDLEILGMRFGTQSTGIARFADETIDTALRSTGSGSVSQLSSMQTDFSLIRRSNMRLVANAAPLSGPVPEIPPGKFEAELFLVKSGSPAAKLSRGFRAKASGALMRYAPPGMLALFTWNTVGAIEALKDADKNNFGQAVKSLTNLTYGVSNLMYWLGHITEAYNLQQKTKLAWLTDVILDVEKIGNPATKSLVRAVLAERWISLAKIAGRFGALLEVVLAVWNGIDRLRASDHDAAAGYFVAATGFLVFTFSQVVTPWLGLAASMAPVVAFIAVLVALGGLFWAVFATDDDLETWIKNGPFGSPEPAAEYLHLHDNPGDAFQFLVGALFPVKGLNRDLSHFEAAGLLSEEEKAWMSSNNRQDGHVLAVDSAAFILMGNPQEQFRAHFWHHPHRTRNSKAKIDPDYVYYDAKNFSLRFHFPKRQAVMMGRRSIGFRSYTGYVQMVLNNGGLLPVTELDEPLKERAPEPEFRGNAVRWLEI